MARTASGAKPARRKARVRAPKPTRPARVPAMTGPPEPETDSVQRIFRRYAETKDLRLRDEIVAQHLYLVQAVAKKFVGMGEPYEDLVQEGTMGLLNAVDLYDFDRGIKFSTYATHLVTGHIRHYLRDRGRIIRQPAWVQELGGKITKVSEALRQELKRDPTVEEIASRLNMAADGVQEILNARDRAKVASLDAPGTADDESAGPSVDVDKVRSARQATLQLPIEDKILLQEATRKLKDLERRVVRYFFYQDLNQTEIARRMGISVNYASYLLRGALSKLRTAIESQSRVPESRAEAEPRAPVTEPAVGWADPATGLACAPYFDERVRQEIERARRYPETFAVMILETYDGAPQASLWPQLADCLRRSIRQVDVLARYSHTGFALLLPHTGREARILGERLVRAVPGVVANVAGAGGESLRVAAGYSVYPADGRTPEQLVDGACSAAKRAMESGEGLVERAARTGRRPAARTA
jgi:RNA polymerase sigma-B factor